MRQKKDVKAEYVEIGGRPPTQKKRSRRIVAEPKKPKKEEPKQKSKPKRKPLVESEDDRTKLTKLGDPR